MAAKADTTIRKIRSLEIQGARNVAKAAIAAFSDSAAHSKARSQAALRKELESTANALSESRPTEPMMRNLVEESLRFATKTLGAKTAGSKSIDSAKKAISDHADLIIARMDEDAKRLSSYGARIIPADALVLTHCHSSTTTMILKEAARHNKGMKVVCFETRPRFQGRTTAAELAKAGLDVTLAVDGAMTMFMKKADIVIVGADSVTSRGDLINKIGTSTLAHIARMNDVSFYSAAELSKYSPMTIFGNLEKIEERDHGEVWDKPPKGVKIKNPAFEATAAKYINGYVTEAGVIPPQSFFTLASEKLGIKLYE